MLPLNSDLSVHEGKTIADFCEVGYTDGSLNHCAHWVSHVLGYAYDTTCRNMKTPKDKSAKGAMIRVHEVFARCPEVGNWSDKPTNLTWCLAFVTAKNNVDVSKKKMANVPKKHIGIFDGTNVWHYSNTKDKVVKVSPADFQKHYSGSDIAVFYGKFLI